MAKVIYSTVPQLLLPLVGDHHNYHAKMCGLWSCIEYGGAACHEAGRQKWSDEHSVGVTAGQRFWQLWE